MLTKLCRGLKQTAILFTFANALSVEATYYFTPETQFTEEKPSGWNDSWHVSLRSAQAFPEPIFEGQWTETSYQNPRPNDIVSDWVNGFSQNPFPGDNPLDDLERCTGDHPRRRRSWSHPTHHGIQVIGPCDGQTVVLNFSSFPLDNDQLFAVKLYGNGVEWQCPWDDSPDNADLHQRSLPSGYVLRKKTSAGNFCSICFNSSALPQRFALLIQGLGIGSSAPQQWGSILCLYCITEATVEWYDSIGMPNLERKLLASIDLLKLRNLQQILPDDIQRQAQGTTITSLQGLISQLLEENSDLQESNRDLRQRKERLQRENYVRHFIGEISELQNFSPGDIEKDSRLIGNGKVGNVYPGRIRDSGQDVIIKELRQGRNLNSLQRELNASETLKHQLKHRLNDLSEDMAKFQGFPGIVTVLGQTSDGHLIQERVQGENLRTLLRNPQDKAFYDKRLGGFPQDLKEAKRKALGLATIIQSIHSLGMYHNDLYSDNVMLDDKGHIHVIDLELAQNDSLDFPLNDILGEIGLLHSIFWGTAGINKIDFRLSTSVQQWFEEHLGGKSFDQRETYFLDQFRDLNRQMRDRAGKVYSNETIGRLSRLMARMADPNPDIRPNDKEICEELTEIWLLPEIEP